MLSCLCGAKQNQTCAIARLHQQCSQDMPLGLLSWCSRMWELLRQRADVARIACRMPHQQRSVTAAALKNAAGLLLLRPIPQDRCMLQFA